MVLVAADDAMDVLFELIILRGICNGTIHRSASLDLFFANTKILLPKPIQMYFGKLVSAPLLNYVEMY